MSNHIVKQKNHVMSEINDWGYSTDDLDNTPAQNAMKFHGIGRDSYYVDLKAIDKENKVSWYYYWAGCTPPTCSIISMFIIFQIITAILFTHLFLMSTENNCTKIIESELIRKTVLGNPSTPLNANNQLINNVPLQSGDVRGFATSVQEQSTSSFGNWINRLITPAASTSAIAAAISSSQNTDPNVEYNSSKYTLCRLNGSANQCDNVWSVPSLLTLSTDSTSLSTRIKNCNARCEPLTAFSVKPRGIPTFLTSGIGICTCQ